MALYKSEGSVISMKWYRYKAWQSEGSGDRPYPGDPNDPSDYKYICIPDEYIKSDDTDDSVKTYIYIVDRSEFYPRTVIGCVEEVDVVPHEEVKKEYYRLDIAIRKLMDRQAEVVEMGIKMEKLESEKAGEQ